MTTLVQIVKTLVVLSALSLAGAAVSWVARKIGYETGALKTGGLPKPCKHGKYDGHWPKRVCRCVANKGGEKGVWRMPPAVLGLSAPGDRWFESCWHEPWCNGAGLDESQVRVMAQHLEGTE